MDKQLSKEKKNFFISKLTEELSVLRAKANLSQEKLANYIGISRQTYYAVETKQKQMSWSTFLSLLFVYNCIPSTKELLIKLELLPDEFLGMLRDDYDKKRNEELNKLM